MTTWMIILALQGALKSPTPPDQNETYQGGKIKVGMMKDQLVGVFGQPKDIIRTDHSIDGIPYVQVFFKGDMCAYKYSLCSVIVKNDKVESWKDFKGSAQGF